MSILSAEELTFIRQVFSQDEDTDAPAGRVLVSLANPTNPEVLGILRGAEALQLTALYGNVILRFPIGLVADPRGQLSLEFRSPTITDRAGKERPLRVHPEHTGEISLADARGLSLATKVVDISETGLSVESNSAELKTGTVLNDLVLRLPTGAEYRVRAEVVRVVDSAQRPFDSAQNRQVALTFEGNDETVKAALGAYVFERFTHGNEIDPAPRAVRVVQHGGLPLAVPIEKSEPVTAAEVERTLEQMRAK